MKVILVITGALAVCGLSASAASIEQLLDFSVTGWYQGVSTNNLGYQRERSRVVRITSDNIVKSLAIDRNTNYYRGGRLFYKTPLDYRTNQIVIRIPGKTGELDVTDAFTWETNSTFVVDQLVNNNVNPPVTNSYVEIGLRSVSFMSSNLSFSNVGLAEGTLTRSTKIFGAGTNGFANQLAYSGGGGTITLNTNIFHTTNFQFVATSTNTGPAQIGFRTSAPVILPY